MFRPFCLIVAALTLTGSAWLAFTRFETGQPALRDFAAMSGAVAGVPQGAQPALPEIRPPFYRALLPHNPAWWLAINVACGFAVCCWIVARTGEPSLALLWAVFPPVIVSLFVGQDSLILVAIAAGVFLLLEAERPVLAGLLLAALWVKFQFLPEFVLLLIVRKQWRALAAFAAGTLALLLPVAGQLPGYTASLLHGFADPSVVPCRECMPNLYALNPHAGWAAVASLALLAATGLRLRARLSHAFAIALAAALLTSMHAHVYDAVFLFLAVSLVTAATRPIAAAGARPIAAARPRAKPPAIVLAVAAWAIAPVAYLLPYAWQPARIAPALTALALWTFLWIPGCLGSSPAPDEYRKA